MGGKFNHRDISIARPKNKRGAGHLKREAAINYLAGKIKTRIAEEILRSKRAVLFLDYDGTLVPIALKPEMAKLRESTKKILESLAGNRRFSIGIITGRKMEKIKSLIRLKKIVYAGNHGLEIEGPGFKYVHPKIKKFQRTFRAICLSLSPLERVFPGSFLENKNMTLSYHYRGMSSRLLRSLRKGLLNKLSPWLKIKKIKVTDAKKAFEIRPNLNWDKGSAVRWILARKDPKSLPIYIGDDQTDEQAFNSLNERGITIKVGSPKNSAAQYFVKNVYEVWSFLAFVARLKNFGVAAEKS